MDIKVQLAALCAASGLPMAEFCRTPAFLNLETQPEIIEKIEAYRLPEVTKLICGSERLSGLDWAGPYQKIRPLYQDYPSLDVVKILLSFQTASEFEAGILKYADAQILSAFSDYFGELQRALDRKRRERTSIKKKLQKLLKEQPEGQEPEGSAEAAGLEAVLPPLEEEIGKLSTFLRKEKLFVEKTADYLQKAEEIEERRETVYGLFREQKLPREERFLQSFIETGALTEEDAALFRDEGFVACLLLRMGEEAMRDYAVPILMKLYEEGVIDLVEGPASDFLSSRPAWLCSYLQEKLPVIANPTEEEALLLEKALEGEFASEISPFREYWNRLTDRGSWVWLLCRLHALDPEANLSSRIAHLLSGLSAAAGNALAETVFRWQEPEVPVAAMEIYSEWMRRNQIPGGAMLLDYFRGLDQNARKLQRKLNTAERRIRSQGQEVFSSLYRPMEQLEELAVSLGGTRGEVKAGLVSSSLKHIVTELRDGLEALDVQPLADMEDWSGQRELEYDPRIHSMAAPSAGKSSRVSLSSMGFRYCDEEGEQRQYPAKVSPAERPPRRVPAARSSSGVQRSKPGRSRYPTGGARRNQSFQRNKRGHQK